MVRTRNTRNSSGGGGGAGGQHNKDNSPTFKPSSSGNKKGRKRQLTESSGSSSSSSSSMLTPSCSSTAMALLAPSYSDMMTVQQQHPQYLAPAPGNSSFNNNFHNNNPGDQNIESVEAIREHLGQDLVETVQQQQAAAGGDQEDHDIVHSAASDLVIFSNRDAPVSSVSASAGSISAASSQTVNNIKDDLTPTSLVLPDDLKQNLECPVSLSCKSKYLDLISLL